MPRIIQRAAFFDTLTPNGGRGGDRLTKPQFGLYRVIGIAFL